VRRLQIVFPNVAFPINGQAIRLVHLRVKDSWKYSQSEIFPIIFGHVDTNSTWNTVTPYQFSIKVSAMCGHSMKQLVDALSCPKGPMAGIPLNGRQAKKSVSDGKGTGVSGQKKGRVKSWEAGLEGRLSLSPVPLVTPSGARWGSGKEGVLHALLGDR